MIELTWLPNPMPTPSKIRPMMSIEMSIAAALRIAPKKKLIDPTIILDFLPFVLVT